MRATLVLSVGGHLHSRAQKCSKEVDQILRARNLLDLLLLLSLLLPLLSLLVKNLLVADLTHLLRVAVLGVEVVLTLK